MTIDKSRQIIVNPETHITENTIDFDEYKPQNSYIDLENVHVVQINTYR